LYFRSIKIPDSAAATCQIFIEVSPGSHSNGGHHPPGSTAGGARCGEQADPAAALYHPLFRRRLLTKHQLYYFGTQLHFDETATRNSLQDIGNQLKKQIELAPMTWNSIGTFRYANDKIEFEPHVLPPLLQPVAAERVLREGVQHDVLVGDTVVRSDGTAQDAIEEDGNGSGTALRVGPRLFLSVFFIIFYLYLNQFQPTASGLHKKTGAPAPEATYREVSRLHFYFFCYESRALYFLSGM
jgi:hypothetical protein